MRVVDTDHIKRLVSPRDFSGEWLSLVSLGRTERFSVPSRTGSAITSLSSPHYARNYDAQLPVWSDDHPDGSVYDSRLLELGKISVGKCLVDYCPRTVLSVRTAEPTA